VFWQHQYYRVSTTSAISTNEQFAKYYVHMYVYCLLDNSPTKQLTVSQVMGWSTRRLVNSPTASVFLNHGQIIIYLYAKQNPKSHLFTVNFIIKRFVSWPVSDLTDLELVCQRIVRLPVYVVLLFYYVPLPFSATVIQVVFYKSVRSFATLIGQYA